MLVLAFCCVVAVAVCVALFLRLRGKDVQMKAVLEQPSEADGLSAPYELAAIDQYLYDRCCRYMTEFRPFLVSTFSLQDLANAVYTNKFYLSKTINRFSGGRQYISGTMDLFKENKSLRITEMAQLCGFHSTTSFNQSFKLVMGETPSVWCSRIRKKHIEKMR